MKNLKICDDFAERKAFIPTGFKQQGHTLSSLEQALSFSGFEWIPRTTSRSEQPGWNNFSAENVWVDSAGLHLKISRRNNHWQCAEVVSKKSPGYGTYIFQTASRVDLLDKNAVAGLFTRDDAPEFYHREIDIEFTQRWSESETWDRDNAQFAVAPYAKMHEQDRLRFKINLNGDYSTHSFMWVEGHIFFQSFHGHYTEPPTQAYAIKRWPYSNGRVPKAGNEKIHINLWLKNSTPPSDGRDAELIVKEFKFKPQIIYQGE